MATGVISANYQELEKIAQQFATQQQQIQRLTQSLMATVDQLRQGGWVANSANQYYRSMDQSIFPSLRRLSVALGHSQAATLEIIRLFHQAEEEATGVLRGDQQDSVLIKDVHITEMKRIEGELFVKGGTDGQDIHPSDAQQGYLGDCFFVSSLATLAQQNPDFIKRHIQDNGDGSYNVTLYHYQEKKVLLLDFGKYEAVKIRVEPTFPEGHLVDLQTGKHYATTKIPHIGVTDTNKDNKPELWPLLYEKAYAQLQGSGDAIKGYQVLAKGGQMTNALSAITGQVSTAKSAENFSIKDLSRMQQQGYAMTIATEEKATSFNQFGHDKELVESHAYYITGVDEKNNSITIRNPWGWYKNEITVPQSEFAQNFSQIQVNPIGKN